MKQKSNKIFNRTHQCHSRVGGNPGALKSARPESGRSMVEMLGTLAIVGVLSAGAIGGYSYAMNKHRTNELIYEATKRAQWVGTQLELNRNPTSIGFGGFGTDKFAGGEFYGVSDLIDNQFEIQIKDVTEAVCENLIRNSGSNNVVRFVVNPDTHEEISASDCTDSIKVGLVFNRDLSTNDPTETPETPITEPDNNTSCNGHGTWDSYYHACWCEPGYAGSDCSQSVQEACNTNHGFWNGYGYCTCDDGWGGTDCSLDISTRCNNHGTFMGTDCYCDLYWGGEDCSVENACNRHGRWINCGGDMYCECDSGWGGNNCSTPQ